MKVRISLAYDGTDFHGWQIQPEVRTVQGVLSRSLQEVCGHEVKLIGAGRTDAGVHALGQVAHAELETRIPPAGIAARLRSLSPRDIEIYEVVEAPPSFHARRSALARAYEYRMVEGGDLFRRRYALEIGDGLDVKLVRREIEVLLGEHDFSSFCSAGEAGARVCRVLDCGLVRWEGGLALRITADHFLYNMVRILVGTLLELGRCRESPRGLAEILEARDRGLAGPTAPPQGLFLVRIDYPDPAAPRPSA